MPDETVEAPQRASPSIGRRLALMAACIGLGSIIGSLAEALGGGSAGFLAIPVLLALAWFFVGDPAACTVRRPAEPGGTSSTRSRTGTDPQL